MLRRWTFIGRRAYATRRPERPPQRITDPLAHPDAVHRPVGDNLVLIHRPPPSAPSPHSLTTNPASPLLTAPVGSTDLPPPLWNPPTKSHRTLTEEQVTQIRRLREHDPVRYSAATLARKFGCSSKFVAFVAPLAKHVKSSRLAEREKLHADARSTWGDRKRLVKEIRAKRRSFW